MSNRKEFKPILYYWCGECGSKNVEVTAWVDPNNDDKPIDADPPRDVYWCNSCDDESKLTRLRHTTEQDRLAFLMSADL